MYAKYFIGIYDQVVIKRIPRYFSLVKPHRLHKLYFFSQDTGRHGSHGTVVKENRISNLVRAHRFIDIYGRNYGMMHIQLDFVELQ